MCIYVSVLLEYIVSTISSVVCEARLFSLFWFAHAINNQTIVCVCLFLAKSHAVYLFSPSLHIPAHPPPAHFIPLFPFSVIIFSMNSVLANAQWQISYLLLMLTHTHKHKLTKVHTHAQTHVYVFIVFYK